MSCVCLFCDIINGKEKCHKIWEDDYHLAFLSIFPNTDGFTVVVTKQHHDSYAFDLPDDVLSRLVLASKTVGKIIDSRFDDVGRTGMILEGFGVNHVHSKLFPMHGTKDETWRQRKSSVRTFFGQYEGYISSHDGVRADDNTLDAIANMLRVK